MGVVDFLFRAFHVVMAVAVVLLLAAAGRYIARRLRQPEVIGEITCGVLAGPALVALAGQTGFRVLLPVDVLGVLRVLATAGLVLFLVGLTHSSRVEVSDTERRSVSWVMAGAFLPSLLTGAGLAWWISAVGEPRVRGTAPIAAFVLFLAVAVTVTAAPVLARILADRGMTELPVGRIALKTALLTDSAAWFLLTVAVGLTTGSSVGFTEALLVLLGSLVAALVLHRLLRARWVRNRCTRSPRASAVVVAALSLAAGFTEESLGMTAILGAVLVGAVIPTGKASGWQVAIPAVVKTGRSLVPIFFVTTGVTVFITSPGDAPLLLIAGVLILGVLAKFLGSYLGARLGGQSRLNAFRLGSLLNTRGLTELVVLQTGYSAGIISHALFLALLVLAFAATAMTGPLLAIADMVETRRTKAPELSRSGSGV